MGSASLGEELHPAGEGYARKWMEAPYLPIQEAGKMLNFCRLSSPMQKLALPKCLPCLFNDVINGGDLLF